MKRFVLIALMIVNLTPLAGQAGEDAYKVELPLIVQANQGNSYITFPTDIGNIQPLWFEANLIPNFYIRDHKTSNLMAVLTPQVIIRMYREDSYPIRTPSYIPQITLYYNMDGKNRLNYSTLFGRLGHHSNGQDGSFFLEDGSLNTYDGDFGTNFLEFGIISLGKLSEKNAFRLFAGSLEMHPKFMSQKELHGIYSPVRLHFSASAFRLRNTPSADYREKPAFSLKAETGWMLGKFNGLKAITPDRFTGKFTAYYHPPFLEDVGLFVQLYTGLDYYNMYFNEQRHMIRFGLMTEKLRF